MSIEIYKGPLVIRDKMHGHDVKITYVQLWTEREINYETEFDDAGPRVVAVPGLASWHGQGRVPGLVMRLLDALGGEVELILPDGRTGKAYATGYSQDSAWIIELAGIGKPPE